MKLYIIAGEDSGDLHASNLMRELKQAVREVQFRGVGGDKMEAAGAQLVAHVSEINFMGFLEVVKHLGKIRDLFKKVKQDLREWKPDAVVLVDYPGFNLRIAKFIKKLGIRVYYYISPQVWAWKKGRVKTIGKYTEKLFVILPFEKEFYAEEGLEVEYVGHPLLDVIPAPSPPTTLFKQAERPVLALLPGSRKQEIKRMLPVMLELPQAFPSYHFVIAGAPSIPESFYREFLQGSDVELRMNRTYEVLAEADFAIVTSGTATLETALFQVPQVVVYKGGALSFLIGRMLVKVKYISLVNLIMGGATVTELVQAFFKKSYIAAEIQALMQEGERRESLMNAYTLLRQKLGEGGASKRTAGLILKEMKQGA